jgi:hypothetical protein
MTTRTDRFTNESAVGPGWTVSPTLFAVSLSLIFIAIVLVARANVYTLPLPNEDDASFFVPSWNLAVHGTLRVPLLNAPDGIFWMPHGFYVWQALFLRIFGPTIEVARTVCQLTTAFAAVLVVVAYARICRSRGFALLCGALLVSPGVIFCANLIRMEPLILLIFGIGLLLHSYGYRLAAAAIFFLSMIVHPALILGATLYAVGIIAARMVSAAGPGKLSDHVDEGPTQWKRRWTTILIVAAVVGAIGVESVYVLRHLTLFDQHMGWQVAHKAARSPVRTLLSKRGLFFILEMAFTAAVLRTFWRRRGAWHVFVRDLLPVFLLILGLSAYSVFGREVPYNVYTYALIPATFGCLTYRLLSLIPAGEPRQERGELPLVC